MNSATGVQVFHNIAIMTDCKSQRGKLSAKTSFDPPFYVEIPGPTSANPI